MKSIFKSLVALGILILMPVLSTFAQMAINTTGSQPDNSAMLDIQSSLKGLLIPRMTTSQRTSISNAAEGLLVYDTDIGAFYFYHSNSWVILLSSTGGWSLAGNSLTGTELFGSTNNQPVKFYSNNLERMRITETGNVGIGITTPSTLLDVAGSMNLATDNSYGIGGYPVISTKGTANTLIGIGAGKVNTGSYNTAVGYGTLYSNTSGTYNVAIGPNALYKNMIGSYNIATGYYSLYYNISGVDNTAIGLWTLTTNTTGNNNTAIGYSADVASGALSNSTAIGNGAVAQSSNEMRLGNSSITSLFCKGATFDTAAAPNVCVDANGKIKRSNVTGGAFWSTSGNSATNPSSNFIGTTDNHILHFRVNNQNAGMIDPSSFNLSLGYHALFYEGGQGNTALGWNALMSNSSGNNNTATGTNALQANNGTDNTAYGHYTMYSNTSGNLNAAFGSAALYSNTTGHHNTAIGMNTLTLNVDGYYNTAIGYNANIQSGSLINATAIGHGAVATSSNEIRLGNDTVQSLYCKAPNYSGSLTSIPANLYIDPTTGQFKRSTAMAGTVTSVGLSLPSGEFSITGSPVATSGTLTGSWISQSANKIFASPNGSAGTPAFRSLAAADIPPLTGSYWGLTGNSGTNPPTNFIGTTDNRALIFKVNSQFSGRIDTVGNTSIGYHSLPNSTGIYNTAIGKSALFSNIQGFLNTATGVRALFNNTEGYGNTANGFLALELNNGDRNTASGYATLASNTSGSQNTAYGTGAGYSNQTGNANVAIGNECLHNNTATSELVAIGDSAMFNSTGSENTAVGSKALFTNSSGERNSAFGNKALYSNTLGFINSAFGTTALYSNTSGYWNTACGAEALYQNNGFGNTAVGLDALYYNMQGNNNTAVGLAALQSNDIGGNNTALGYRADVATDGLNNATAIGNGAIASSSDEIRLGNNAVTSLFCKAATTDTAAAPNLCVDANGKIKRSNITGGAFWSTSGNSGTNPDNNFIGTTDNRSLIFKANNVRSGWIDVFSFNCGFGVGALFSEHSFPIGGWGNAAFGNGALYYSNGGIQNSAFGNGALNNNSNGYQNSALGCNSLYINNGRGNTAVGYYTGGTCTGDSNVFIGYYAGYNETGSHMLYIANSNTSSPLIYGDFSAGKATINSVLKLAPMSSAPSSPTEGELYVNSTDHHIYCYLNGIWKQLD